MSVSDAKRLKQLEEENAKLKKLLAEAMLDDECLNETSFTSLRQARAVLAAWQLDYNEVRPHSAHGGEPPASIRLPPCSPASQPRCAPASPVACGQG